MPTTNTHDSAGGSRWQAHASALGWCCRFGAMAVWWRLWAQWRLLLTSSRRAEEDGKGGPPLPLSWPPGSSSNKQIGSFKNERITETQEEQRWRQESGLRSQVFLQKVQQRHLVMFSGLSAADAMSLIWVDLQKRQGCGQAHPGTPLHPWGGFTNGSPHRTEVFGDIVTMAPGLQRVDLFHRPQPPATRDVGGG